MQISNSLPIDPNEELIAILQGLTPSSEPSIVVPPSNKWKNATITQY